MLYVYLDCGLIVARENEYEAFVLHEMHILKCEHCYQKRRYIISYVENKKEIAQKIITIK